MVILEDSFNDDFNDLKKLLVMTKYNNIVIIVVKVLANYDKYYDDYNVIYKQYIPNIINDIKNKYQTFMLNNKL